MAAAMFCVLLTSDRELAARVRMALQDRRVPFVAVDTVEHLAGMLASVIPTHVVIDQRDGAAVDLDRMLGRHRAKVRAYTIGGDELSIAAFLANAREL